MDSPSSTSERPSAAATPNRRRVMFRFLAISISLLVILWVLFLALLSPSPQFVWLTPAQMAGAGHPGKLTELKYRLIRLAGPLMRFYHSHRPNVLISATIMKFSAVGAAPTTPGPPFINNDGGMNAWILSPSELFSFRQALKTNSAMATLASPRIQTASGVGTSVLIGQSIPLSPGVSTNVGIAMDATAKVSSGSVNLLLGASSTELSGTATTNGPAIKTNFSASCRVLLPDAGALVINCRNSDPANPTNYWLIVSPVLVDATGKPVKK